MAACQKWILAFLLYLKETKMGYRLSNRPLNESRVVTKPKVPKSKILFFVEGVKTEIIYLLALKKRFNNIESNSQMEIFDRLKHSSGDSHQLYVVNAAKEYLKRCQSLGKKKRNFIRDTIKSLEYDNLSIVEFKNMMDELERKIDDVILDPKDELKSQLQSIKTAFEFDEELGDKVCFILDRDHHSFKENQFDDVLSICEEENYELGISTPNFEFFLLLHLTDDFSDKEESYIFNNTSNFTEERLKKILKEKTGKSYNKSNYEAEFFLNRFDIFNRNIKKFEENNLRLKSELGSSLGPIFSGIIKRF